MPDPTLAVVGTLALTEGIKFLYGQAGEILKRWRERKPAEEKKKSGPAPVEKTNVQLPSVFAGQLTAPTIHFADLALLEQPLLKWRKELANYTDGTMPVETTDENLLVAADELRKLLEAIYRQRITFKGEQREPSGTSISANIKLGDILGAATLVDVERIKGGTIDVQGDVGDVGPDGEFVGVRIKDAS